MPSQNRLLTPEQLALSEARKKKKAEAAAAAAVALKTSVPLPSPPSFLQRAFLSKATPNLRDSPYQLMIMSWNMLAQCLVRRELFPTSDCLKASQREKLLYDEITASEADVICLQEADRLEKLGPVLEATGYDFAYSAGPRKKHGCVIAYKRTVYKKAFERTVLYDDAIVRPGAQSPQGASFRTRNIGLIVALRQVGAEDSNDNVTNNDDDEAASVVVATTHLFWHPKYTYERARQSLILLRSIRAFQNEHGFAKAPAFVAGDFNFNPSDAAYSLLVGDPLTPEQKEDILFSHVVHVSLDPTLPLEKGAGRNDDEEEEEGEGADASEDNEENDPDRVIKNARRATPEDGLLNPKELADLFADTSSVRSAYDEWGAGDERRTFGSRTSVTDGRRGRKDPIYTSYTHYWKSTLDYIFVVADANNKVQVEGVLEPALPEQLGEGLPRKGVCGSDHLSLRAHLRWTPSARQ